MQQTEATLGEQLLLLSLDDESGAGKGSDKVGWAIAAATLVELAMADRIEVADGMVSVLDPTPLGVPGLDGGLADIVGHGKPRKAKDWMPRLRKGAVAGASQGLLGKGLIREETKKVLGLFPVRRYPEADGSVEAAVRERLDAVVLRGQTPDARTASLVSLLHGAKLHRLAFPGADAKAVKRGMAAVAEGQWAGPVVRRVIEETQAVLAVMITTTVTTTTMGGGT